MKWRRARKVDVFKDPELLDLLGDDPELLAIADAVAQTQCADLARRRRPPLLIAAALALMIAAIAVPALAAFTHVIDFRSSPKAPRQVVIAFSSLDREAPPNLAPNVVANETRRLRIPEGATERSVTIFVAPTKKGGYCIQLRAPAATGCDSNREVPFDLGVAYVDAGNPGVAYGTTLHRDAVAAEMTTADGGRSQVGLTRVSAPIDAAVFLFSIPAEHLALPITVRLLDARGGVVDAKTIEPFGEPESGRTER